MTEETILKTLESLGCSGFRKKFRLFDCEKDYTHKKGRNTIYIHAVDILRKRIAPANPSNDGRQTPMKNHPVFIAQHATATCCRGCIEKWHGISKGRKLSETEIGYFAKLICTWIELQITEHAPPDVH